MTHSTDSFWEPLLAADASGSEGLPRSFADSLTIFSCQCRIELMPWSSAMAAAAPAAENVRSLNIPADGRMSTRRPAFTEGTLCVLDCELHSLFLITRPEIELHQQKSTNSPPKNDRPVRIEQQSFLLMERLEMGPQQPTEMEILPEDKNPARNPGGWFCKDPEGDAENLQAACVRVPGVEPGEIRQYSGIFNFDFRVSSGRCTLRYVIILCDHH